MINIGIIGAGGISYWHSLRMKDMSDKFTLKSVCDVRPESVQFYKDTFGYTDGYNDYNEMLKDIELDAVLISVPHYLHEKVAVAALKAGKHVLLEKPLAPTVEAAKNIVAAAKEAGKVLLIGLNERYCNENLTIKHHIDNNTFGKPFSARIDHFQNFRKEPDNWWYQKDKVGGGCVMGSGIHRLDLLRWFFGDAEEVFAYQAYDKTRLEAESNCNAVIKFKNGVTADFVCNWGVYGHPYYEGVSVYCQNGGMMQMPCPGMEGQPLLISRPDVENGTYMPAKPEDIVASPGIYEHFYDCIVNGAAPLTGGEDSVKTVQLVLAIYESASTGKPVKL